MRGIFHTYEGRGKEDPESLPGETSIVTLGIVYSPFARTLTQTRFGCKKRRNSRTATYTLLGL